MTPEREETIKRHWQLDRDQAIDHFHNGSPIFRSPVRKPLPAVMPKPDINAVCEKIDVLEFTIEHGYIENKPMSRVLCEGLEVEIGPRLKQS
jgi:hypothetical protein